MMGALDDALANDVDNGNRTRAVRFIVCRFEIDGRERNRRCGPLPGRDVAVRTR